MNLDRDALLDLVHRYYPSGLYDADSAHVVTPENRALKAAQAAARQETWWSEWLQALRADHPGLQDWTHLQHDACWRVRVPLEVPLEAGVEGRALVFCVSILAPLDLVYSSVVRRQGDRFVPRETRLELTVDEQPLCDAVRASLTARREVTRLPPDLARTPVHDIAVGNLLFGETTLADALFTPDRW